MSELAALTIAAALLAGAKIVRADDGDVTSSPAKDEPETKPLPPSTMTRQQRRRLERKGRS